MKLPPFLLHLIEHFGHRSWLYPALTATTLVLGALREMQIAKQFGLGPELDAYAAATCLYLFLGTQLGNGLETTFIAKYAHTNGFELRQRLLVGQVSFFLVLVGLLLIVAIGGKTFLALTFDFQHDQLQQATQILFAFVPAILLCALMSLPRATLYIRNCYALGFGYGGIVSICVMMTLWIGHHKFGIFCLPVGYALGNLVALIISIAQLRQLLPKVSNIEHTLLHNRRFNSPLELWQSAVFVLAVEVLFQGSYLTERAFAAQNGPGALSAYFYGVSLLMVFAALVIQPITTLVFPKISRAYRDNPTRARQFVLKISAVMFLLASIAAIAMYSTADLIIKLWLVRGNFSAEDGAVTAQVFRILILILPFMSISKILKNSLYSSGGYRLPIITNAARWVILAVVATWLTPSLGIRGVALASIVATGADCLLMLFLFLHRTR